MERIISSPLPHKEPMSAILPRLLEPWPSRYRTLAETMAPIEDVPAHSVASHNPAPTYNPTVSNSRFVSSPPIPSIAGGESSTQMVSIHSNACEKPPA